MGSSESTQQATEPNPFLNENGKFDLYGIEIDYIDQITGQPRNPVLFAFIF